MYLLFYKLIWMTGFNWLRIEYRQLVLSYTFEIHYKWGQESDQQLLKADLPHQLSFTCYGICTSSYNIPRVILSVEPQQGNLFSLWTLRIGCPECHTGLLEGYIFLISLHAEKQRGGWNASYVKTFAPGKGNAWMHWKLMRDAVRFIINV
jgi:hypothetical protein